MAIEKTDEWRDEPCGCRLQKSIFSKSDGSNPLDLWVIREECPPHARESAEIQEAIQRWRDEGGPFSDD